MSAVLTENTVTKTSVAMGARVEGLNLTREMTGEAVEHLRSLINEHHLLVLPDQNLEALELERFGRLWGDLLTHPSTQHRDTPHVQWIAGKDSMFKFFPGTFPGFDGWHSDMTWHSTPPIYTGLHARRMPKSGGNTAFANQHLAYEMLSDEMKTRLNGLQAFHTGKVFGTDVEDSTHPVIRTHDDTGRKALFVNANFTKQIIGMSDTESQLLLFELFAHSVRPEFTYRHQWAVNDLVLWDNRSVMHYAIQDYVERRVMHRIVVKGGVPR